MTQKNLSSMQEEQLLSLREEMRQTIDMRLSKGFTLLMLTYYPLSEKLGASIMTTDNKLYFGKGASMAEVADEVARSIAKDEYVLQSPQKVLLNKQ